MLCHKLFHRIIRIRDTRYDVSLKAELILSGVAFQSKESLWKARNEAGAQVIEWQGFGELRIEKDTKKPSIVWYCFLGTYPVTPHTTSKLICPVPTCACSGCRLQQSWTIRARTTYSCQNLVIQRSKQSPFSKSTTV